MAFQTLNEYFQNYSIKLNGLMIFTQNNPAITAKLKELQEHFDYTVGAYNSKVKKEMKIIDKLYAKLSKQIQKCREPEDANKKPGFFQKLFGTKSAQQKAFDLIDTISFHVNEIKTL